MRSEFYMDDEKVKQATDSLVCAGETIFQAYRLGADNKAHASALLNYLRPRFGARVLDIGCGIGTVSDLMEEERPDLKFTLLNLSLSQLHLCRNPDKVSADMDYLPFRDRSFDAVMFNYSIGHAVLTLAIQECSRVLTSRGVLFIYDVLAPHWEGVIPGLEYHVYLPKTINEVATKYNFKYDEVVVPDATVDWFIKFFGQETFEHTFKNVLPIIYRYEKQT